MRNGGTALIERDPYPVSRGAGRRVGDLVGQAALRDQGAGLLVALGQLFPLGLALPLWNGVRLTYRAGVRELRRR